jgi:hypothetical protein
LVDGGTDPEHRCDRPAHAQTSRYEELAELPFEGGYPTMEGVATLKDEQLFQRAVQSYIWALPALNMYGMKKGSEKTFGTGYDVLPIWKDRLNAKTLVTTPNSDVIYAMGFLDLKKGGAMVIEVPPGLQASGMTSSSGRSARSARSRGAFGAATSDCPGRTMARAASI